MCIDLHFILKPKWLNGWIFTSNILICMRWNSSKFVPNIAHCPHVIGRNGSIGCAYPVWLILIATETFLNTSFSWRPVCVYWNLLLQLAHLSLILYENLKLRGLIGWVQNTIFGKNMRRASVLKYASQAVEMEQQQRTSGNQLEREFPLRESSGPCSQRCQTLLCWSGLFSLQKYN